MKKIFSLFIMALMLGCATHQVVSQPKELTSDSCRTQFEKAAQLKADAQLDEVSDLFARSCFHEAIALGDFLRHQSRDKFYNITSEALEMVTPEGTFTEYVMESYERGYLTILISLSYLNLQKEDDALVELRRGSEELNAQIYNHGEDPVLNLLMAALWDRFDSSMARPYWRYLSEFGETGNEMAVFAQKRIQQIDAHPGAKQIWSIDGFGYFPELEWKSDFIRREKGPYRISAMTAFPQVCASATSLLVPTNVWVDKIAMKYQSDYHPFLYAKSLARLPFGIGYGVLGTSAGVAVGVGGCGLDGSSKGGNGQLCKASLDAAGTIIHQSLNLVEYTLKPDLRHWKKIPLAFSISAESSSTSEDSCHAPRAALYHTVRLTPN
jgi:hypothetical protein